MSTGLQAPPAPPSDNRVPASAPPAAVAGPPSEAPVPRETLLLVPVLALLAAACLPLARAVVGWGVLQPALAAVAITVGLSWGARRLGVGPLGALAVSALGWVAFVSGAFLASTTVAFVVPTPATLEAFPVLWVQGVEHIRAHPAPTLPDPGLLLLIVTGVWAVSHAVDGLVFRLQAPVKAILLAGLLWIVPLLVTVDQGSPAVWTVPLLGASALLLLVSAGTDIGRWGQWVRPSGATPTPDAVAQLLPPGALIAGVAIVAGVFLAATLPGFNEPPWYELRGAGGTTLTTNPIVTIRPSLVSQDPATVLRVTSSRPVYLRTTSLDVYSDQGEWTNAGIRGASVSGNDGSIAPEQQIAQAQELEVAVEVVNLPKAVLVPAPYQPRAIASDFAAGFQYDARLSTITTDRDATLEPGDRYRVTAAAPDPDPETVRAQEASARPEDTALPGNVPQEVADLARRIVEEAGARTPFERALAIQEEFQSEGWAYSLDPPGGHSGDAMLTFITDRVGYCEQYAGTMAVMLRTLGIPARVAVGFTPGAVAGSDQAGRDTYDVSNRNAHAWVEVLFPGHGWLAFEPTPRDDGNVLRPSAGDPAPTVTDAERAFEEPTDAPEPSPEQAALPEPSEPESKAAEPEPGTSEAAGAPSGADDAGRRGWLLGLLTALVGLAAIVSAGVARRHGRSSAPPLTRILSAHRSVERTGAGLGLRAAAWETEQEYLGRLAGTATAPQAPSAAVTLGRRVAEARYAPALSVPAADEAETAAGVLRGALLADRSGPARLAVRARGAMHSAMARLRVGIMALTRSRVRRS